MLVIKLVAANKKEAAYETHYENHTHSIASFFLRGRLRQQKTSGRNPEKVSYEELTQDPQLSDVLEEMDDESREKLGNSEEIVGTQGVLTKEETEPQIVS